MDWLKELSEQEIERALFGDLAMLYTECGLDVLIKLCEKLTGMNIYISAKPINVARAIYIKKHYNGKNCKELAIKLGVSERYVHKVIKKAKNDKNRNR